MQKNRSRIQVYFLFLIVFMVSCDFETKQDVIFECISPTGLYKAKFIIESSGGAAGSVYEHVSIVENNIEMVVLKMKGGYDCIFEWPKTNLLKIGYPDTARIDHWQNFHNYEEKLNIEIYPVSSKGGKFINDKTGCR